MSEMFGISNISIAIADKSTFKDLIADAGPPQIKEFLKEKPTTKKKSLISKFRKVAAKIKFGTRKVSTKGKLAPKKVSTKATTKGATKASAKTKATTAANSKKVSVKRYANLKKSTKETRLRRVRQQANVGSRLSPAIGSTSLADQEILAVGISEEPDSFVVVSPMSVLFNIGRAFVNLLNPFTGGGTKTRERESKLIQLCNSKLDFMAHAVSREPEYAAVLVASDRILSLIVDDYERISRSKTKPVVLRSSLSVIREDDEEETQVGGGTQTMTMTIQKPVEPTIIGPYSSIEIAAEKAAPQQTLPSGTKVITISRASAKSLLEQRLAAFLWFGFSRGAEAERLENEVFKPLLPELVDSIAGDAHNVLFWQLLREVGDRPYDFYESLYDEALYKHFEHGSRSPFKKARARHAARKVLAATTRKVQSPPKEEIPKSSSTQNSEAAKRKLQSNAITRRWAQAK